MPKAIPVKATSGTSASPTRKTGYEPRPEAAPPTVSREMKAFILALSLLLLGFVAYELMFTRH
jgi:hypothetical protein